jgi:hypothetical protein
MGVIIYTTFKKGSNEVDCAKIYTTFSKESIYE